MQRTPENKTSSGNQGIAIVTDQEECKLVEFCLPSQWPLMALSFSILTVE